MPLFVVPGSQDRDPSAPFRTDFGAFHVGVSLLPQDPGHPPTYLGPGKDSCDYALVGLHHHDVM